MNCYISGILWFLLISLLWGRKIVAPPCLVIGKSGLERGPRREFFFQEGLVIEESGLNRRFRPPSLRSRPLAAEPSIEASGRRSLDGELGPFLWALPLLPLSLPFLSRSLCLPRVSLPSSPSLLSLLSFLGGGGGGLPFLRTEPFLTEPSSQSPPRRALLTEHFSQSPSHRALLRRAFRA